MLKRWVLTTWLLEKSGYWDPVSVTDIPASDVDATLKAQTALYGEPKMTFGDGGETVAFKWKDGPDAEIVLRQKPCD